MNLRNFFLYLSIALLLLTGCAPAAAQGAVDLADRPIRAVATTGMVADIVANVGGERVDVTGLMGAGVDPHLYKPTERNVIALAGADIVFYNGLHLEAQMGRVFERMQGRIRSVAVAEGIDETHLLASPAYPDQHDPHVWFDVTLWMAAVERVRDGLVALDPQHSAVYEANAAAYLAQLAELHAYVLAQAERIPADKRVLITAHDAFSYFGRTYGFEVYGLQGISTATEAGTGDVQDLAAFIVERQIPALFVESSVPPRAIAAVQAAVRARGFDVQVGGELFSDAMGNPGTPEGTYIGMVRHNIDTLVAGLLGNGLEEQ